jgi:hypothetical protein
VTAQRQGVESLVRLGAVLCTHAGTPVEWMKERGVGEAEMDGGCGQRDQQAWVARCSRRGGTGRGRCSSSVQRIDPASTGRSSAATQRTEQGSDDCSRAVGLWAVLQSGNVVVERRARMQVRGRFRRPALWLVMMGHVWL